ncbi:MAG: rod-binding protein [Spirochaetaceae bacterium]|nr:rod-binding protein [Spirochaetaceae bacterium]
MNVEAMGALNIDEGRFNVNHFKRIQQEQPAPRSGSFAGELAADMRKTDKSRAVSGLKDVEIDRTSKLYEQCEALESFFLKTLISGMRKIVNKSNLIDTGFAGEVYEDMLWDERTKTFAQNSGFGFADLAYLELTGQRGKAINRSM